MTALGMMLPLILENLNHCFDGESDMNTDFRISIGFTAHPKTIKLMRRCGDRAVFCLLHLWSWVAQNKPDGDLAGMDDESIEIAAGWVGEPNEFILQLADLGWIDGESSAYVIHDWKEHNPWAADAEVRSERATLSKLAQANREAFKMAKALGVESITRDQYDALKVLEDCTAIAVCSVLQIPVPADSQRNASEPLAPSPSPSPSPNDLNTSCDASGKTPKPESAPRKGAVCKRPGVKSFEKFWNAFADKRGKDPAWKAWKRIKGLDESLAEVIIKAAALYSEQRKMILDRGGTPKMAQGWLNDRRWEDEVVDPGSGVADAALQNAFSNVMGGQYEHASA